MAAIAIIATALAQHGLPRVSETLVQTLTHRHQMQSIPQPIENISPNPNPQKPRFGPYSSSWKPNVVHTPAHENQNVHPTFAHKDQVLFTPKPVDNL
jgi:hypothetical protein